MCVAAAALVFFAGFAEATIREVPSEYATIQAAIVAAEEGDTVRVAPGAYFEELNFLGKAITVASTAPEDSATVANTVIDANAGYGYATCVTFETGEGRGSILAGFTLQGGNGEGMSSGGGITSAPGTGPTIAYCVFVGNTADNNGTAVNAVNSTIRLVSCTFTGNNNSSADGVVRVNGLDSNVLIKRCTFNNNTTYTGGAIVVHGGHATITDCEMYDNTASFGGAVRLSKLNNASPSARLVNCLISGNFAHSNGGAISLLNDADLEMISCLIVNNDADGQGGAIYVGFGPTASITNCTFAENSAGTTGGIHNSGGLVTLRSSILWNTGTAISGTASATYCDIQGGWPGVGNLNTNPMFTTYKGIEYLLGLASPVIDAGDPSDSDAVNWPEWYNNGSRADMGTYGGPQSAPWFVDVTLE